MKLPGILVGLMIMSQQVTIPRHPERPGFRKLVSNRRPLEVAFDSHARRVTVTVAIRDPHGDFIPNLHPNNFRVEEDGIVERSATVSVEHVPVSLAILVEGGSRYQDLNESLANELPVITDPITGALQSDDIAGLFAYGNGVQTLVPFGHERRELQAAIQSLKPSGFSETNLNDALITVLHRTAHLQGHKAVLLLSTGFDTFSRATFDDVVADVERTALPVYSISLTPLVEQVRVGSINSPLSKINWHQAVERLKTLASVSGGRTYVPSDDLAVPAICDDMMEHLRIRYVIRYVSSETRSGRRSVKVSLIDPRTNGPLGFVEADGAAVTATTSFTGSYIGRS